MGLADSVEQLQQLAAQIQREALVDDKTPLGSGLALRQELREVPSIQSEYVVVFGDLNDFKHINDDYSHEAGDVALQAVGEAIRDIVIDRLRGRAYRRSGNEFVILLQQESVEEFLVLAPSLRDIPFRHNNRILEIGMSLGYAIGDGKATFEDLLQRADAACQLAKRPGVAHCVKWTKELQTNPLIRIGGWCADCNAKVSCTLPKTSVPSNMLSCPCCERALETSEDTNHSKK